MIRAVSADRPSFKTVEFTPGFNIVLAERTEESGERDSRNGLGKSTLIDIIHYCLGSTPGPGQGVRRQPLSGWTFILDLDLRGRPFRVRRKTTGPHQVTIQGDLSDWPIQFTPDLETGAAVLSIDAWT